MLLKSIKTLFITALTAVAVPYAVALTANILYGWPLGPNRYQRAFHPNKVLQLNYALLLHLRKVRYFLLSLRWHQFYLGADKVKLIKDICYGCNSNSADIYLPALPPTDSSSNRGMPVVIFVYGGTWSSGDKNMYGLLCNQLANNLSAVVVCPNYSLYPKGFVDDMVQDISDVISLVQQRASEFGGDKNRIVLIGHSAGAHLAALSVLELALKRLGDEPQITVGSASQYDAGSEVCSFPQQLTVSQLSAGETGDVQQLNQHGLLQSIVGSVFRRNADNATNQSLCIVDAPDDGGITESFYMVDNSQLTTSTCPDDIDVDTVVDSTYLEKVDESSAIEEVAVASDSSRADDSKSHDEPELNTSSDVLVVSEGKADNDALSSIKLVIGLAGVYNISVHYQHEAMRGVEDISTMARAMYGPKQFDRFSPTIVVESLPPKTRLPAIHLIHGTDDIVVPEYQSRQFGEALIRKTIGQVSETVLTECGHYEICLDLMEASRYWHNVVMSDIRRVFTQHVSVS